MSGHTPGPWIVGAPDIRCTDAHAGGRGHGAGQCNYRFQGWHTGETFDRYVSSEATHEAIVQPDEYGDGATEEDCRLIAAAPDLLAAAKDALFMLTHASEIESDRRQSRRLLSEAIAKAEGPDQQSAS